VTHKHFYLSLFPLIFTACAQESAPAFIESDSAPKVLNQLQMLKASNANYGDQFGVGGTLLGDSVVMSTDGSTLAVGATFEAGGSDGVNGDQDSNSLYGAGAVYIYDNQDGQWVQSAYLKPSNPGVLDNFGYSVEISATGDTLVVSSVFEASSQTGINPDSTDDILLSLELFMFFKETMASGLRRLTSRRQTQAIFQKT
jgi:hypothetical protein